MKKNGTKSGSKKKEDSSETTKDSTSGNLTPPQLFSKNNSNVFPN